MDASNLAILLIAIGFFGVTIYLANVSQITQNHTLLVRMMLYVTVGLVFLYAMSTLQVALLPIPEASDMQLPEINTMGAVVNFGIALALCAISVSVISSPESRLRLKRTLFRSAQYDPDSIVHTTAVVLSLALVSVTIGQVVLAGGVSGLAESIETDSYSIGDTVLNQVLWVILALLGVGLFLRRSGAQTLERLGLRLPTAKDIRAGLGVGFALYLFVFAFSIIWAQLVPPEVYEQQNAAAEQIAGAFNTLPLALILALASGIGEEILFRGALQPVFGIWMTSLLFAVLHTQYTLTPASLTIFVVGLMLGWLRQRHSTSAAVLAHFTYNFVILALPLLLGASVGV